MIKPNKNIAFIFARGGSKGLHRKNIKTFHGKPLIAWTIKLAIESSLFDKVIVSTDDDEIMKISKDNGAEVPFLRPSELSRDISNEWFAWKHAVESLSESIEYNFVCLPCVCPLRIKKDIEGTINLFNRSNFDLIFTISKSDRSPYVNMVELNKDNEVQLSKSIDSNKIFRRQDSPQIYNIVPSVYITSPKYILENNSMWAGKITGYEIPNSRSIDIDSETDFKFAEMLFQQDIYGSNSE